MTRSDRRTRHPPMALGLAGLVAPAFLLGACTNADLPGAAVTTSPSPTSPSSEAVTTTEPSSTASAATPPPQTTSADLRGQAVVGEVLRLVEARTTDFSPPASRVRVRWLVDNEPVPGAHGLAYRVRPADVGRRVAGVLIVTFADGQTNRNLYKAGVARD